MTVNVINGTMSEKETKAYIDAAIERFGEMLGGIDIEVLNDEEVKLTYHLLSSHPFERVRRITGYLVGTLDRWNNAKRAEEHDRIKHSM